MPIEGDKVPDNGTQGQPRRPGGGAGRYRALAATIKHALRARGVTYRELARRIGMSESGVKKLLNGDDGSFSRLSDVADAVGVALGDLIEASEQGDREVELDEAAQRYLLQHPRAFALYWKLAVEGLSVAQVRERYGVSAAQTSRMLAALERLGLLRYEAGQGVRLESAHPMRPGELLRWVDRGPLLEQLNQRWSRELAAECAEAGGDREHVFRLHLLRLRPGSAAELRQGLEQLVDAFRRRSQREVLTTREQELRPASLLVAVAPRSFVRDV